MKIATLALTAATLALGMANVSPSYARMAKPFAHSEADANKDGTITCSEYKAAREQRFQKFDSNGDGGLTLEEITAGREAMRQERLQAMMTRIDSDKDGKLNRQEFEAFSKSRHGGKMHRTSARSEHDRSKRHMDGKKYKHNRFEVCD